VPLTDAWDNVEKVADICAGLSLQRVESCASPDGQNVGAARAQYPLAVSSRRAPN
jgi:hypothetical protein